MFLFTTPRATIIQTALFSLLATIINLFNAAQCNEKVTKQTGLVLVGVMLQPMSDDLQIQYPNTFESFTYIEGDYVDWIQMGGSAAILIPFDLPIDKLNTVLNSVQMVFFPGGDADLVGADGLATPYMKRLDYVLNYAKAKNDNGTIYPVIGTCLGFEAMLISLSGMNTSVLQGGFTDVWTAHSLNADYNTIAKSKIWSTFDQSSIQEVLSGQNLFYYHTYGITPSYFAQNPVLPQQFYNIGSSVDSAGHPFIGSLEHIKYPFILNQWHPEASIYHRTTQYQYLNKSPAVIRFMTSIIVSVTDLVRTYAQTFSKVDPFVQSLAAFRNTPRMTIYDGSERMYFFPRVQLDYLI